MYNKWGSVQNTNCCLLIFQAKRNYNDTIQIPPINTRNTCAQVLIGLDAWSMISENFTLLDRLLYPKHKQTPHLMFSKITVWSSISTGKKKVKLETPTICPLVSYPGQMTSSCGYRCWKAVMGDASDQILKIGMRSSVGIAVNWLGLC